MKDAISEPSRLRDRHDQPDLVERIAGQAARDTVEPTPLARIVIARIAARIDARRDRGHRLPSLSWPLVIGAFLLGIVTAASAAHLDLLPRWLNHIVPGAAKHPPYQAAPAASRRRAPAQKQAPTSLATSATDEKPQTPPAPEPMLNHRVSEPVPHRTQRMAMLADRPAAPSPPPTPRPAPHVARPTDSAGAGNAFARRPESAVPSPWPSAGPAEEPSVSARSPEPRPDPSPGSVFPAKGPSDSPRITAPGLPAAPAAMPASATSASASSQTASLLKEIVRALRVERAPRRALALLDQHGGRLAGQAFAEESLLLRVEAMLALGDRAAVLRLLDRTSLTDLSVSSTLLITRGELRAAANRCAEGVGDFDLVLAESRRPPKPALLGRARCKQKLGDLAGAQADFDRYRHEFPRDPMR